MTDPDLIAQHKLADNWCELHGQPRDEHFCDNDAKEIMAEFYASPITSEVIQDILDEIRNLLAERGIDQEVDARIDADTMSFSVRVVVGDVSWYIG